MPSVYAEDAPVAEIVFCPVCGQDTLVNEAGACDWCHVRIVPDEGATKTCECCGVPRNGVSRREAWGGALICPTCNTRGDTPRSSHKWEGQHVGTCAPARIYLWPEHLLPPYNPHA